MIGYQYFVDAETCWRGNQGGILPISPGLSLKDIDDESAQDILKRHGGLFLRWETEFDCSQKYPWWHIIKDSGCAIGDLSRNTRNQVRRGLKAYHCTRLEIGEVLGEGYDVYSLAYERYQTHEIKYSRKRFEAAITSLPKSSEFWGARESASGRLVGFAENYVEASTCFYNTLWFSPESLKEYASYALFFEMNRHYLEDREFHYVSDGARSLSHATEIHDFLVRKFGFRKAHARLHVTYTPWLRIAVRLLYPFRRIFSAVPTDIFRRASILLKQEEVCRRCQERTS